MFKEKPRPSSSPLEKNDHPELDDPEEVDAEVITQYQLMIGALQWVVSLMGYDFCITIMIMSCFCVAPHQVISAESSIFMATLLGIQMV